MCFICGGSHYTKYCPNSSGNSTYDLPDSCLQPQPYHNSYPSPYQSCNPSFVSSSLESLQNIRRMQEVANQMLRDSMEPSHNSYPLPHPSYNEIEYPSFVSSSMENLENIQRMQEAVGQMLRESMNQHIDPMNQHIDPFCGRCTGPHWSKDCPAAPRRLVPMIWDDEWDLNQGGEVEIEGQGVEVAEDLPSDPELLDSELETKMDDPVPPSVQQDMLHSTPYCYGPEPIDDDFWSEDEEGVVEEMELEMPDYTTPPREEEKKPRLIIDCSWDDDLIDDTLAEWRRLKDTGEKEEEESEEEEHPVDLELSELETIMDISVPPPAIDDDFLRHGDEKEEEEKEEPSWETEFGDELVNLPTLVDEEIFDPVGDLAELEALLAGEPTMEIKESPKKEEEEVVEEEEHHCRPVVEVENESPNAPKPRERAQRSMDHTTHHRPHTRFGPKKYKKRWPNPFESFKRILSFTIHLLKYNGERKELNGLDMGWIKYKPPD